MKTYLAKTGEIKREALLFDASEAPVGRLAVRIANALRGKDRPTYTPHIDTGAFVIVINADKAVFTGHEHFGGAYFLNGIAYYSLRALVAGTGEDENSYAVASLGVDGTICVKGWRKAETARWPGRR